MSVTSTELADIAILRAMNSQELTEIAPLFVQKTIKAKHAVFCSNKSSKDIYFVLSGQFTARSFGADGREVAFGTFKKGECFGEMGNFEGGAQRVSIEADCESTVLKLSGENFGIVARRFPSIMAAMLEFHAEIINCLAQRVFEFSTMPVALRVRRHLIRLSKESGSTDNTILIDPAPSHYEIAVAISTHREAVSRELSSLTANGIIETGRRSITIIDMQRLAGIVESESKLVSSA